MPKILGVHSLLRQDDLYVTGFTAFASGNMKLTTVVKNTGTSITIDNSGTFTKLVALKNVVGVNVTFKAVRTFVANGVNSINRYNSSGTNIENFQVQQSGSGSSVGGGTQTITVSMNAGDYLVFTDQNNTSVTDASITANCPFSTY